jgi:hypothetical protein
MYFLAYKKNIIENPLVCFLISLNFCTPTAINLMNSAIINKFQIRNLSKIILYQYFIAIFTLTIWNGFYLYLFNDK